MELNKEKQIDEMGADICTLFRSKTMGQALASLLYDKGYRKASEVAREIIDQIIHYTDTHKAFIARIPIQELIKFGNFLGELDKKYTEDGK